jgi:hypothetical protein
MEEQCQPAAHFVGIKGGKEGIVTNLNLGADVEESEVSWD